MRALVHVRLHGVMHAWNADMHARAEGRVACPDLVMAGLVRLAVAP